MQDKIVSITIDGYKIDVSMFLGREALKISYLIQQKILPAIAGIVGSSSGGMADIMQSDIGINALEKALSMLYENIGDDDDAYNLVKRLVSGVTIYAKSKGDHIYYLNSDADFDEFFMGKIDLLFKIVLEVLKINYPFFLEKIAGISKSMRATGTFKKSAPKRKRAGQKSERSRTSPRKPKANGNSGSSVIADIL